MLKKKKLRRAARWGAAMRRRQEVSDKTGFFPRSCKMASLSTPCDLSGVRASPWPGHQITPIRAIQRACLERCARAIPASERNAYSIGVSPCAHDCAALVRAAEARVGWNPRERRLPTPVIWYNNSWHDPRYII